MAEFQFIEQIKQKTYNQSSLIKGIGDDAAVFRERSQDIVITKDTFVEGVHFSKKTMTLYHVGYRVLAANISDLAAMGATPLFYLVSIVIPNQYEQNELRQIYEGMKALGSSYNIDLIGGDTVSGQELVITVTAIGKVVDNKVRYRHTSQVGDIVFVTGMLGDSRAGLHLLMNELKADDRDYFIKRHQMPEPRVKFALSMCELNRVTLNDVSDGLVSEVSEIAEASNKSIVLVDKKIPTYESFSQFAPDQQFDWKYFGGEDFELVGTVAKDDWTKVKQCANDSQITVNEIGYVIEKTDYPVYIKEENNVKQITKRGYIHLK